LVVEKTFATFNKPIITLRAVTAYSMAAPTPLYLSCWRDRRQWEI